jgi:CRP/FNR family transcriptional regulator, polysaccharide utilization system transcription regulator
MKTILLIEDNQEMRENTTEILELAGYNMLVASNGKEGVKLAQQNHPDLIVCDIMMPEMDGYDVLYMLSKNQQTAVIPFIFLTAKTEKSDYQRGMNLGADGYLTKPFHNPELLNAIEVRLKRSEMLKGEFSRTQEGLNEFFKEISSNDVLKKMSEEGESRLYKKKDTIYIEGGYAKGIFFISKGKIKTCKTNEGGKEYITGLHKEGDFIGYTTLLEETPYLESAIVLEDAEVIVIPKEVFFSLLFHNREVAGKFIKMLAANLAENEERLIRLAYNSVRKRVAEALLMMQRRYQSDSTSEQFSMSIAREDIAGLVGTATETVVRTLSDFKEEKLISVQGSTITILNTDKLKNMKN